jgi:hypothetical protein
MPLLPPMTPLLDTVMVTVGSKNKTGISIEDA